MNIDAEMRHVNVDGVVIDDEGKVDGKPVYRALPTLHSQVVRGEGRENAEERDRNRMTPNNASRAVPAGYDSSDFGELHV